MEKIGLTRLIGRIVMFFLLIAAAAVMAGCASTTYLVERDKWPAFDTIIVEDVKVAEGVEMPADAVAEFNELLFAKIKEDLGGKYLIIRDAKQKDGDKTIVISIVVTKWYKVISEIHIEITGIANKKEIFKFQAPVSAGLIWGRSYLLKGTANYASGKIGEILEK